MSGRDDAMRELENRLRRESPMGGGSGGAAGGGLSDEARARLRDRLAHTAPEPGAPPSMGGRGAVIGAVALLAVVVGVVVVSRNSAAPNAVNTPKVVDQPAEEPLLGPEFGSSLRDQLGKLAQDLTSEAPMLEEARRIAIDLRALRGVLASRASVFDLRADRTDG